METTYKNIIDHLGTNLPEIRFIDLDTGQIDQPEENYSHDYPALFIRFAMPEISSIGHGHQAMNTDIVFRLVFQDYNDTTNIAPSAVRTAALEKLTLVKRLHATLQGFIGDYNSAMERTAMEQEERGDGLLVFRLTYGTIITDSSAMPKYTKTEVDINLVFNKSKG